MLGWSGVCYQFNQIWDAQSHQSQRQLIDIDGYTNVEVDKDSQLLIYSFPREDCIRLDELLNSIRSEYVKIYGAQAIILIWNILLHHDKIKKEQRIHGNLTSRNVWIVLNEKSERFRCIFSKLDYKIHFTGYQQKPQNNEYDRDNECSSVVADILNVLEYCQSDDHKQKQSNQNINLAKIKSILFPYATQKQQLVEQITKILNEYLYLEDEQRFLNLDCQQYTKLNNRGGSRFQTVVDDTIKIIFQQKPNSQLITLDDKLKWRMTTLMKEIQFWNLLPGIMKEVQAMYYRFDLKKELKQIELIEPSIIDLIKAINNLKSEFYGLMLEEFQKELDEEFGMVFKIEIKLDQTVTEPHYMNLFRAAIAEHMNDLDSFKSLNDKWFQNKKEFEATIFKRHKPYLLQKHEELFVIEIEALIASLL